MLNFPEVGHAHLDDRHLGVFRHLKQGIRQANLIVVISLGLVNPILGLENHGGHILGRGLTVGTRYPYHNRIKVPTVEVSQVLESLEGIIYEDHC